MSRDKKETFPSGFLTDLEANVPVDRLDEVIPWRLTRAERGESCRWVCVDSRWVSVSLGEGEEMGKVLVEDSSGQREVVGSYEGALALAKTWRTW